MIKTLLSLSICIVALGVVGCGNGENDSPIPTYVTLDYYATPHDGEGMKNLLVRNGKNVELYGIADTLKGSLTDEEMQALAAALKAVSKWDTTYENTPTSIYETVRKIHPEGISTIRRSQGADAPESVVSLLKKCGDIARRLRAEAQGNR